MPYTLNDISLGTKHNLATVTLHEAVAGQNRVVHIVVPIKERIKLTAAQKKKQAKTVAKAALLDAAAAL